MSQGTRILAKTFLIPPDWQTAVILEDSVTLVVPEFPIVDYIENSRKIALMFVGHKHKKSGKLEMYTQIKIVDENTSVSFSVPDFDDTIFVGFGFSNIWGGQTRVRYDTNSKRTYYFYEYAISNPNLIYTNAEKDIQDFAFSFNNIFGAIFKFNSGFKFDTQKKFDTK